MQSLLLGLECKQKILQMHFEVAYFYFVLSLGIKTIHTNLPSGDFSFRSHTPVVPSKTIPDSRPKWPKNHILWGGTFIYAPPPPPLGHTPSTNRYHRCYNEQKLETLQPIKSFVDIFIYCTRETGLGLCSRRDSGKNNRLFVTFAESQYI